jgi:VIT1/CCC1 family predicted Fe2+/Mn2+ transporter
MKPSESLYWIRASLGVVIGALTALYGYAVGVPKSSNDLNNLFLGLSFALLFFIMTYYALKLVYIDKFKKTSKIITTGIGIYFILWIVTWVLVHTLIYA